MQARAAALPTDERQRQQQQQRDREVGRDPELAAPHDALVDHVTIERRAQEIMDTGGYSGIVYILEEDIISDIPAVYRKEGANILLLKAWGISESSKKRIRDASIKAMGVDLTG